MLFVECWDNGSELFHQFLLVGTSVNIVKASAAKVTPACVSSVSSARHDIATIHHASFSESSIEFQLASSTTNHKVNPINPVIITSSIPQ